MRNSIATLLFFLAAIPFSSPALADNDLERANARMIQEMMSMLKETMGMLNDGGHQPNAAERQRLEAMMQQLDAMMSKHRNLMSVLHDWRETP